MNYKHLIVSVASGLTVILLLYFVSEYSDPPSKITQGVELNSNELREKVNKFNSRGWSKSAYDSLSTAIQNSKSVASDKERESLQLTLDGHYCNAMKLAFENWKNQGCNGSSDNPKVSILISEMNNAVQGNKYRSIDIDPLKPLISEYNDIQSAGSVGNQVLSHLSKDYDDRANQSLEDRITNLYAKTHIRQCPGIMSELALASTRLSDFESFYQNFLVKQKINILQRKGKTNKELCEELRSAYPEVDKYQSYYK